MATPFSKISDYGMSLLSAIPDMIVLCDKNLEVLDVVNPKPELMDEASQTSEGKTSVNLLFRNAMQSNATSFSETLLSGNTSIFDFSITDKEKRFHYEVHLSRLEADRVLASVHSLSKVATERIESSLLKMQEELAVKNKELSLAMSVAKLIPWECDLKEKAFFCNYDDYHHESALAPDAQGRYTVKVDEYIQRIHPDFREHAMQMIQDLQDGKHDEFQEIYLIHWFNDREYEWVQVQSCIYKRDADGLPLRIIGSAQCVTEQKELELTLRQAKEDLARKNTWLSSVMKIARVLPWECDLTTQIFFCDYENYHFDGLTPPDEEGRYKLHIDIYFSRIHPDYRNRAIEKFADLISGQTDEFHETYPIHWYNEEDYEWVEAQSSITKVHADGTPLRIVGSAQVVTEQKRMEETLREAKEQAEQSNVLKSAFLANMSHEIRTPLNAIVGFSDLLAQSDDIEEKQEFITIIKNSNELLLQLIGDILDLSKIEAGTLEFSFENHDLNKLMDELACTARMKVDDPAIEVAWTECLPECTIYTDRNRLLQVFHNFVNNAAKFTRQGYIHFGYRQLKDGRWYFYVSDTGCGIAADRINDIFERFIKLDRMAKGTGLGLTISKSIVEHLGGEIGVESVEGEGSTFWFTLPQDCVTELKLQI